MPTIRELVANLGFKVDTTGATRFDAAVNRSRKNLTGLNTVSLSGLVNTATKAFAIVTGVVTAGSLAAAKKFADLQRSWKALKFATGENFGALKKEIDGILKDKVLKNLIDEAEILDGTLTEIQEKGFKGDQFIKFLRLAALLAIQTKKPFKEVLGLITGFVVEGDLGIFKLLRELPPELQELFKAAGISPAQVGFIGRGEKVSESLRKVEAELERNIIEQRERGLTTFKELGGAFEKLAIQLGDRTLPAFKDLNDILIPIIERLTNFLKVEPPKVIEEKRKKRRESLEELIPDLITSPAEKKEREKKLREFFERDVEDNLDIILKSLKEFFTIDRTKPFFLSPVQRGHTLTNQTTNNRDGDIHITNHITVQEGADGVDIGRAIAEEIGRKLGTVKELNSANTPLRGGQ